MVNMGLLDRFLQKRMRERQRGKTDVNFTSKNDNKSSELLVSNCILMCSLSHWQLSNITSAKVLMSPPVFL